MSCDAFGRCLRCGTKVTSAGCPKCPRWLRWVDAHPGIVDAFYVPALLVITLLTGCGGGWASTARTSIDVTARAVDVGDGELRTLVERDCAAAADVGAPHSDERNAAINACLHAHAYDAALDAVHVADHALRAAQAAVDAAEHAGSTAIWDAVAPELTRAWCALDVALAGAGVYVPREITMPLVALVAVPGTCRPPVTDHP